MMTDTSSLETLLGSRAPMWVFDTDQRHITWANEAALEFWQAASIEALSKREYTGDSFNVNERLAVIVRTLQEQDSFVDSWTLYPNDVPTLVELEFRPIELANEQSGLLVELKKRLSPPPDPAGLRMVEATRATSSIITMMSTEGRVLMQNPAALKCYGMPMPANSDLTDLEIRLTSEQELKQVYATLEQNRTFRLDAKVNTLDGIKVHSITIQRGRDPVNGDPVILLSEDDKSTLSELYLETQEQTVKLQKDIEESTERLERIKGRIDRALDVAAIWDWDVIPDKLYFSPNFMHLLGYEEDEFIKKLRKERFKGFLHPQDYTEFVPVLEQILNNPDKPISHEMRFQHKSGDYLWIQIEGKSFCDEDGRPVRTAGLLTDITQKKKIEATLLAAQKLEAVGKLTGGIAHDFNNLLTVILGNVQLLEELGVSHTELTGEIVNAVERGAELTRHLLAFARKQSLKPENVDIAKLSTKMRATLLRILSETITINYEGPDDVWDIFADAAQVEAAILNIALNSRDAMPNGGTVTIACENITVRRNATDTSFMLAPGQYVRIAISDTGLGMDAQTVEKAFDPFFSTKDVGKGTGLGLSMVLGFSQQSGGTTQISSEPGRGTTVSIYLPKANDQGSKQSGRVPAATMTGRGEHVHILEDNASVSQALTLMIQSLGYRVTSSSTVAEALGAAHKTPDIDVFLVDVILPGGRSGVDFATEISQLRTDPKLVLMSGFTSTHLTKDKIEGLDFRFLPKPFSRSQISKVLAEALGAVSREY